MRTATQRRERMSHHSGGRAPRRWDAAVWHVTACAAALLLAALVIAPGALSARKIHGRVADT